eukprot:g2097.t1
MMTPEDSDRWHPRPKETSRNWESWVFDCAAELFRLHSKDGKYIECSVLSSLIGSREKTLESLAGALYPVDLEQVFSIEKRGDEQLGIDEFSATLIDSMHRLECFDNATTSSNRDPDLTASLKRLHRAVLEDPVLSIHRNSEGSTLEQSLGECIRSNAYEAGDMTASQWLKFSSKFLLRRRIPTMEVATLKPMQSPLAMRHHSGKRSSKVCVSNTVDSRTPRTPGKKDPTSLFELLTGEKGENTGKTREGEMTGAVGEDASSPAMLTPQRRPESDDAKWSSKSSSFDIFFGAESSRDNFPAFAVDQILADIERVKRALHAERKLVRELQKEIESRDEEIELLYQERETSRANERSKERGEEGTVARQAFVEKDDDAKRASDLSAGMDRLCDDLRTEQSRSQRLEADLNKAKGKISALTAENSKLKRSPRSDAESRRRFAEFGDDARIDIQEALRMMPLNVRGRRHMGELKEICASYQRFVRELISSRNRARRAFRAQVGSIMRMRES